MVLMKIMSFPGKKLAMQEKSVQLFQFQYHSYTGVLNGFRTYDGI